MGTTQPIKDLKEIQQLKDYFQSKGEFRNYLLIVIGLNTSLRISDLLHLQWKDVYHFEKKRYRHHIYLIERKTGKSNAIALNKATVTALKQYQEVIEHFVPEGYLFQSRKGENQPISRTRAYAIIKEAACYLGLDEHISCHSLRKTFGYQAWKKGVPPALLMSIYNHSSYEITKRYLGIGQDERDSVFLEMTL